MINRRVITQVQLNKELIDEQKHIMGEEQLSAILNKQLIERFVNDMLSTRLQDIKTEEVIDSDGKSTLQMKMNLYIFNKEELNGLVTMIKNGIEII
jgi:hypothetical protein